MATMVLMPRQGNTVESCVILSWKKHEGDAVAAGETICEVETDKATFEVPAPEDGTVLKLLFEEGADVPVLKPIAVIGRAGEKIADMEITESGKKQPATDIQGNGRAVPRDLPAEGERELKSKVERAISPRARRLADSSGLDVAGLSGSGPGGRIIERDVQGELGSRAPLTPAAIAASKSSGLVPPETGSGIGGRVRERDLRPAALAGWTGATGAPSETGATAGTLPAARTEIPVRGVRKIIAERMRASLQSTAQLTIDMSADATALLALRKRFKESAPERGLAGITIGDMVMFAAARTVTSFKALNAHFLGDRILQFAQVDLAFAVDTERGLVVPVVRSAERLSLRDLAAESNRLAKAAVSGNINPDDLSGGTFTVTNLGAFGVERFTPVLNAPQVAILGVSAIQQKAVQAADGVGFVPHVGLSLTIDHQGVDGAPAARFLAALCNNIAEFDLLIAG